MAIKPFLKKISTISNIATNSSVELPILYSKLKPTIVAIETTLETGNNGFDAAKVILNEHPEAKIIFFAGDDSDANALRASLELKVGAFVSQRYPDFKLISAIDSVKNGE